MESAVATLASDIVHSYAIIDRTWNVFDNITRADVDLCIWRRPYLSEVSNRLAAVTGPQIELRRTTTPASFSADISTLVSAAGLDPGAHSLWLEDMHVLADRFFIVADGREVLLRLELTDDDGCRRYHVDRSYLRLLCTYRGPGTEWLENAQVDREALRSRAPNEDILRSGEPQHLTSFEVGLFKGSLYPNTRAGGLVHRSPPATEADILRVKMCLDC